MVEVAERTNSNIFMSFFPAVNTPPVLGRNIFTPSTHQSYTEEYASPQHHVERTVHSPADSERAKKERKWSFGKLFRRKKKDDDSSSSESEDNGHSPSKRKVKKKKKIPAVNNFDHIVIRDTRRAQSLAKPNSFDIVDDGVLSDPSAGFISYKSKLLNIHNTSKDSINLREDSSSKSNKGIFDTPTKKTRKSRLKARVEALRNSMKGDSSSDEDSLKSSNSSSMIRFRSDESLMRSRDSSLNKKSRSARNERYVKRLSRDEEIQLNKEAELLQQGYTKAEVEMLTRTPTSQSSGYGTCKRDTSKNQEQCFFNNANRRPMKSESISSFPSAQSYPSVINFNAKVNNDHISYSLKYPINITNQESLAVNGNRESQIPNNHIKTDHILCVKLPLGLVKTKEEKSPPVPPPRDMYRKLTTPVPMYNEHKSSIANSKTSHHNVSHGVLNNDFERVMRRSQERSILNSFNGLRRPLSNSEDHIALQNNDFSPCYSYKYEQPRRPASVSAEPNHYGFNSSTPSWRKTSNQPPPSTVKPKALHLKQDYLYFADQSPRSRRPISIKSNVVNNEAQYLNDTETILGNISTHRKPRNASEFWKKLDDAEKNRRNQISYLSVKPSNEQFLNNEIDKLVTMDQKIKTDTKLDHRNENMIRSNISAYNNIDDNKIWKATTEYKLSGTVESPNAITSPVTKSHVRHKSDTFIPSAYQTPSDDEKYLERRKSTNLDDALNELEAIYNSLGLGDEDLLDRAERQEMMSPKSNNTFNDWNGNTENSEIRSQRTTPLRRITRRSTLPDKLQDDMAYRRMNSSSKDKTDSKDSQSQISYMLTSPVYVPYTSDDDRPTNANEPDIVHDDVMYRNIVQTNNRLKTLDPQPPFGIPVGPISPAPQSDYLHATPENTQRSRFMPRKSPDIVSDDLAYRTLRKDNRYSSLLNSDEHHSYNNNGSKVDISLPFETAANIKKKRAVRSLSANIFTMIQKEIDDALNLSKLNTLQKTQSNSDVLRRLRETYENNGKEQEPYPRNKVKHRHHTINLFVNNSHSSSNHLSKDDSCISTEDAFVAKPVSCDKCKTSSPSTHSPQSSKKPSKDEFQQVLTMLAQEAMDTSNKLGVALAELDKNRNNSIRKLSASNKLNENRMKFMNDLTKKSLENLSSDRIRTEQINMPNHSNLNNITQVSDNESKAKKTEDSLLTISNQLNKVEDKLKQSIEKEMNITDENTYHENKYHDQINKSDSNEVFKETMTKTNNEAIIPNAVLEKALEKSEVPCKDSFSKPIINSLNPFMDVREKIKDSNEKNAFQELKEGISDLIAGISQVSEKIFITKTPNSGTSFTEKVIGITEFTEKLNEASQSINNVEDPQRGSVSLSIYEDELEVKKDVPETTEYNSSEELATIFQLDIKNKDQYVNSDKDRDNEENLSSPKLVKTMNQQLRNLSTDHSRDFASNDHENPSSNIVPWRTKSNINKPQHEHRDENSKTQSKRNWHNSGTLMLASTYTILIPQQTADSDWLTLIGFLLATITIVAILLI